MNVILKIALFLGYSGKTTALTAIARGMKEARWGKVGTLKHVHDRLDTKGKDTWLHFGSGASIVMAATTSEICIMKRERNQSVDSLIGMFKNEAVDYLLVEGFFDKFSRRQGVIRILCASSEREALELIKKHGRRRILFITGRIAKKKSPGTLFGMPVLNLPEESKRALKLISGI